MIELLMWVLEVGFYSLLVWHSLPFIQTLLTDIKLWRNDRRAARAVAYAKAMRR